MESSARLALITALVNLLWVVSVAGECTWYGTCGTDPMTGKPLPCAYSGPARPLTDPLALRQLARLCPQLTAGQSVATCCDAGQVHRLADSLGVVEQLLSRCPSCFENFLNIYCHMICSANQSAFLHADHVTPSGAIEAVTYAMTPSFAQGMFNSCRDVRMPSTSDRVLGVLCGQSADTCTASSWLQFLGSRKSGQTPFAIHFRLTDTPLLLPDGSRLTPMNATWWRCSESPGQGKQPCKCSDCREESCPTTPPPFLPAMPCTSPTGQLSKWSRLLQKKQQKPTSSGYRDEYVIVQRRGDHPPIKHHYPPPTTAIVKFNAIFDKAILHEVLTLQTTLQTRRFPQSSDVTFKNVCRRTSGGQCADASVLSYFQDSGSRLDKVVMDSYGFFVMADYMDHLLSCFRAPFQKNDTTALHMPCLSQAGLVVNPRDVFCGYDWENYQNATSLVLAFPIKDPALSMAARQWRNGLKSFVAAFSSPNVTLTYFEG